MLNARPLPVPRRGGPAVFVSALWCLRLRVRQLIMGGGLTRDVLVGPPLVCPRHRAEQAATPCKVISGSGLNGWQLGDLLSFRCRLLLLHRSRRCQVLGCQCSNLQSRCVPSIAAGRRCCFRRAFRTPAHAVFEVREALLQPLHWLRRPLDTQLVHRGGILVEALPLEGVGPSLIKQCIGDPNILRLCELEDALGIVPFVRIPDPKPQMPPVGAITLVCRQLATSPAE
mmetsp:Transcript_80780/g.209861  ORF Transcript_80780/g.209861 Transcript_80780/m.209861 type:complete len:228 (-) Transcript_80780:397-1080(-)